MATTCRGHPAQLGQPGLEPETNGLRVASDGARPDANGRDPAEGVEPDATDERPSPFGPAPSLHPRAALITALTRAIADAATMSDRLAFDVAREALERLMGTGASRDTAALRTRRTRSVRYA